MARILVIDPNNDERQWLCDRLVAAGHEVAVGSACAESLSELQTSALELVLTAWSLPGTAGAAWVQRLRRNAVTQDLPVMVIAQDPDGQIAAAALDNGAEDFVAKPLNPAELLARVSAVLRRQSFNGSSGRIHVGPVCLEKPAHRITINGEVINLAPAAYGLMAFFVEHPGRVFDRHHLLEQVWGRADGIGQRTVDVHVRRLRAQLEPHRCADLLQTVRGFGYRFGP